MQRNYDCEWCPFPIFSSSSISTSSPHQTWIRWKSSFLKLNSDMSFSNYPFIIRIWQIRFSPNSGQAEIQSWDGGWKISGMDIVHSRNSANIHKIQTFDQSRSIHSVNDWRCWVFIRFLLSYQSQYFSYSNWFSIHQFKCAQTRLCMLLSTGHQNRSGLKRD